MTTDELFVRELRKCLLEDNLSAYVDVIRKKKPMETADPDWRLFWEWLQSQGEAGNRIATKVFRHIICDTTSNILAIIDSSANLPTMRGDIKLLYEGQEIQDNLTDNFWEQEEES
jgi:hypothetical protein